MRVASLQSHVLEVISHAPKVHHEVTSFPFCLPVMGSSGGRTSSASVESFLCNPVGYFDLDDLSVQPLLGFQGCLQEG